MSKNVFANLAFIPIRDIPRTPPLNKWGGEFENGWDYFFEDLNGFLQQAISPQEVSNGVYLVRVGCIIIVNGIIKKNDEIDLGVKPIVGFSGDGFVIDENGILKGTLNKSISTIFISR